MLVLVALLAALPPQDPPAAPPELRLVNFRGGEACYSGRGRLLALKTNLLPSDIRVEYSGDSGKTWVAVARENLSSVNGGLLWRPMPLETGRAFRLRVSHRDAQGKVISDQSDRDFSIEARAASLKAEGPLAFTMMLPDAVKGGTTQDVAWLCRDVKGPVSISLVVDGKKQELAKEMPASGSVSWAVPAVDAKECTLVLEVDGKALVTPSFEIDSRAPEIKAVEVEIPQR